MRCQVIERERPVDEWNLGCWDRWGMRPTKLASGSVKLFLKIGQGGGGGIAWQSSDTAPGDQKLQIEG